MAPSTQIAHYNALLTLHHVIKELASKRLGPDRRNFRELTRNCFGSVFFVFKTNFNSAGPKNEKLVTICLKLLRHFIAYGNSEPETEPEVAEFLRILPGIIQNFVENFGGAYDWAAAAKVSMKIALELQVKGRKKYFGKIFQFFSTQSYRNPGLPRSTQTHRLPPPLLLIP